VGEKEGASHRRGGCFGRIPDVFPLLVDGAVHDEVAEDIYGALELIFGWHEVSVLYNGHTVTRYSM
jgi:hypothetical protein